MFRAEDVLLHGSVDITLLFYCVLMSLPSFHFNPSQIPNTKLERRMVGGRGRRPL